MTTSERAPSQVDALAAAPAPLPLGFTEATAQVNGITLNYVRGGSGPLVVLLHGFPQTWYEWHQLLPLVAEHYTVLAPDLRGIGGSSKPATGYDTNTLAQDVYELVRLLDFDAIRLVGHDIGAMVAYTYAAQHAQHVQRLVPLDAPLPGIEPVWSAVSKQLWHFQFQQEPELPEQLLTGRERKYLTFFYTKFAADKSRPACTEAEINEFVRAYAAPGAIGPSLGAYRAFPVSAAQNQQHARTKLPMPVLALGGAAGFGPQIVGLVQQVATDVRGGSVPDAGHWLAEENPDYLLAQLRAFFE